MTKQQPSELRKDLHHGGWVLLPHQSVREQLLNVPVSEQFASAGSTLLNVHDSGTVVVWEKSIKLADKKTHTVRVAANPFALYKIEGDEDRAGIGMYDQMRGIGAHEVLIESDDPHETLSTIPPQLYALTLEALQTRIRDLYNDTRLRSFTWFREWVCGEHENNIPPHSQLIANSVLPLGLENVLNSARAHYEYKERCLFCDIIRQEKHEEERMVFESNHFAAYCPFASRYPFEVHLLPKKHQSDFSKEPADHLPDLAAAMRDIAQRYDRIIPGWRVIASLHTQPVFDVRYQYTHTIHKDFHWHIECTPVPPGYIDWYTRTGMHTDMTPPEKAASCLRDCTVTSPWK